MSRISGAVPRRALAALAATAAAVAVMASFRTPDQVPPRTAGLGASTSSPASPAPPATQGGEVLQAQSASIDTVSGATYTSDAYARSVQAALDQARA